MQDDAHDTCECSIINLTHLSLTLLKMANVIFRACKKISKKRNRMWEHASNNNNRNNGSVFQQYIQSNYLWPFAASQHLHNKLHFKIKNNIAQITIST